MHEFTALQLDIHLQTYILCKNKIRSRATVAAAIYLSFRFFPPQAPLPQFFLFIRTYKCMQPHILYATTLLLYVTFYYYNIFFSSAQLCISVLLLTFLLLVFLDFIIVQRTETKVHTQSQTLVVRQLSV